MADINEEQLLNELLGDVGSTDLQIGAPNLEARVLAAWDEHAAAVRLSAAARTKHASFGETRRSLGRGGRPDTRYYKVICGIAAAVVLTLAVPTSQPSQPAPIASASAPDSATADKPIAPAAPLAPLAPLVPIIAQSIEFIPLMPMTAQEFTGPFQIVRVQMPRASLGALTPLQHPGELIEADVLLGEDGLARAIHISTNESAYPWRPR